MYCRPRMYRDHSRRGSDLISFNIQLQESDLLIHCDRNLKNKAFSLLRIFRRQIEDHIRTNPAFLTSLSPVPFPEIPGSSLVGKMIRESSRAGVGPMATVAGAIAQALGEALLPDCRELIIENGGDLYLASSRQRIIGLYSAGSPDNLLGIGLKIPPNLTPLGICTSSGTRGHSLSMGLADSVVVAARSAAFADAAATRIANMITRKEDISPALQTADAFSDILGLVILVEGQMAVRGRIELVLLPQQES